MTAARKLAAILAADVVGYSRMMGKDEVGTAQAVRERREAAESIAKAQGGRIFKTMGDALYIEFPSVVAAVECAIEIQAMTAKRNVDLPENKRIVYRIGVHLGDVLVEGDDLLGDGVNIAARLEGIAEPGGVCLSRIVYGLVRGKVEAEFLDLGERTLKNIDRPVRVYAVMSAAGAPPAASPALGPLRLSVVVLPFANIAGGGELESFVDGVTENLTTDISRILGAFVIARSSALAYKGKPVDARRIGRELNVRYVLEGSVQRSGERIRVNVQLVDAQSGNHLWADRFDKPVADLFDMQDEIVSRVVNELRAVIVSMEARRAERAASPDSADLTFRGFDLLQKGIGPESLDKAHEALSRALEIEPDNVQALLGQILVDTIFAQLYAFEDRRQRIEAAEKLALRALSSAPRDPMAHYCLGLLLVLSNRAEEGINELTLALSLEPNNAFAHAEIGLAKIALGRAEEAEAHIAEAMRLSPRDLGLYVWYGFVGMAQMHLAADEEAVSWLRKSVEANRNYPLSRFLLAAALARCGRIDSARAETQAGLGLAPDFTVGRYAGLALADNPTYLAGNKRILEGMRLAGVPE